MDKSFLKNSGKDNSSESRILQFLESQFGNSFDGVTKRYLFEKNKNNNSVYQLVERGNLIDATTKVKEIYKSQGLDQTKVPTPQEIVEAIKMAIDIENEPGQAPKEEEPAVDPVESEESEKVNNFDEEKYENIINETYHKLSDPEKYKDTIEKDLVEYIKASLAIELGSDDTEVVNIEDTIDAYGELLNNVNPDTLPTAVWLLPRIKTKVGEKLEKIREKIQKARKENDSSGVIENTIDEINYYESINSAIEVLENSLNPKDEEIEEIDTSVTKVDIELTDTKNPGVVDSAAEEKLTDAEITPHEKLEDYFFKKGVSQIIVHGVEIENKIKDGEHGLVPKMDLDVDSALMVLDEIGVKYKSGAKCTWIHPEAKLVEPSKGQAYFEYNGEKTFLTKGTVIFDVGKSNGFKPLPGDVFMFDHHGEAGSEPTSTTQILIENLEQLNQYKDGKKEFPIFLKSYAELVTKIDNLSMDRDMDIDEFKNNYANTMYALAPLVYGKNRRMLMDIYKKYPNISMDAFTDRENEYIVGVREYTSTDDHRSGFKDIKIYSEIPENNNLDYVYENFTIKDLVENQQHALDLSIKEINFHTQKMFRDGLKIDSEILGRTVFIDQEKYDYSDSNGKIRKFNDYSGNTFGALTAYNMGYDSMIILNRDRGNHIFVSSKNPNGLRQFAKNLKIYYSNAIIVRDSMLILRDKEIKTENPENVRNAIIDSAQIDGFNPGDYLEEVDRFIKQSKKSKSK